MGDHPMTSGAEFLDGGQRQKQYCKHALESNKYQITKKRQNSLASPTAFRRVESIFQIAKTVSRTLTSAMAIESIVLGSLAVPAEWFPLFRLFESRSRLCE
jgi:hypothetical protein